MIKNYLKSALRNITRHKFISFINIFGLTVGLACCLLILTYIINENSYDNYNTNADDTYRVTRTFYSQPGVESLHLSAVAPPFGPLLQTAFPDIKQITRVIPTGTSALHYKEKLFNEKGTFVADEHFFDVFDVALTKGDAKTALVDPYSIMLSETIAKKYFGDEDPMNKGLRLDDNKHEFKVTGVFKAFPQNAHLHPEMLFSFNTLKDSTIFGKIDLEHDFGGNFIYTYLLFQKGYNTARIEAQLPDFLDKYVNLGGTVKTHLQTKIDFQKLTDIHLRSHLDDEIEQNGDIKRVYIFSAIALFILLIACINYMNLATARSVLRAKEIGIRKVIGAQRGEIISQFLSESVLITCVALVLAIALTVVLLPWINSMSELNLSFGSLLNAKVLLPVLALPFVIGLISGIYPALFMSSFIPAKVLKGILKVGSGNVSFRQVLVVLQFSISIILIVATAVVFQQLQFIQNKALGFNKEHIITMGYERGLTPQYEAFKDDLLKSGQVKEVGRSSRIPSGRLLDSQGASLIEGGSEQPVKFDLKYLHTDYGFIPTYGMQMAAGRNFSVAFPTDTNNTIINEAAVRAFGWKNNDAAIGKDLRYGGINGKVIGVVKDFHFESLHQKIIPLVFQLPAERGNFGRMSIKINGANPKAAIAAVENIWRKYLPETPFDYTFLDERFGKLYSAEQQQGKLFTTFSVIAIFIACLGLFGLSAFTITQRVKEIGVRKVLGASVPQIVGVLSRDFLKLVIVAAIIAIPAAWYFMNQWLLDFEFRISISWWVLASAGVVALIVAFATISFQSIKAALANPVKSLRSE
ncbi:ABC transporter permease [Mucilaginibacter pedocola]|uniref:Macrolide export ATP-binding/permease MacB n=1 Tax=Mucilaginibacter pedocola TaxID=1792845 RepID=A0A1S9PLN1_9SPHI|nr:ABC transporter permease [Mucilaginibacter pedocola]OOQ61845.1 macrolide export ATP-binding/permease MacB [Mucilaginibacter pedocola]